VSDLARIVADLRERARYYAGLTDLGLPPREPAASEPGAVAAAGSDAGTVLRAVREEIGDCQRCKLASGRRNIVFGQGNPNARLMFVGEAPGGEEDAQGLAFVGRAGQLLTDIIEKGLKIPRRDVFIANVLKCLRYNTLVQLEDGSWERIGRIVAKRYCGRVMSVDAQGRLVAKRVTGWHRSPLGDRRVYRLSYMSSAIRGGNRAVTWVTEEHEVLTRRGWVHAACLEVSDELAIGQGLSRVASDVVIGSLLGDGTVPRKNAHLAFTHCPRQEEYVRLKARSLAELSPTVDRYHTENLGKPYVGISCRTRASRALRVFRRRFYCDSGKVIPKDLKLTSRILAVWFLDDGYTKVKSMHCALAEIAAHSFAPPDIEHLLYLLHRDLGLDGYTLPSSPGRIHFDAEGTLALSRLIAPFCPLSMRYKLHPSVRDSVAFDPMLYEPGRVETLYDQVHVEAVDFQGKDRGFFCIDVEETNNFVTSGGVVHNCRPPDNRNPEPDEILSCQPFLEKQIDAIRPAVIVGLGKFGAQWLMKSAEPISRLRGRVGDYKGIKVVPTYHPAFLLRTPSAKKEVWEDMKVVLRLLAD
jgi:uracil-DNA glycosylase family 4